MLVGNIFNTKMQYILAIGGKMKNFQWNPNKMTDVFVTLECNNRIFYGEDPESMNDREIAQKVQFWSKPQDTFIMTALNHPVDFSAHH